MTNRLSRASIATLAGPRTKAGCAAALWICALLFFGLVAKKPAVALDSNFVPGQVVERRLDAEYNRTDMVCRSPNDVRPYSAASAFCKSVPDACSDAKKLESAQQCGAQFRTYVVISVDSQKGLLQMSPVRDRNIIVWGLASQFAAVPR
jgi:hypothetical protein